MTEISLLTRNSFRMFTTLMSFVRAQQPLLIRRKRGRVRKKIVFQVNTIISDRRNFCSAQRKPKKIQAGREFKTLNSAIPVQRSTT